MEDKKETIVDQLRKLRERRHEKAERTYSEIVLRFDAPRPGDAEALEETMEELHLDMHHLEADIHLIQQYRAYLEEQDNPVAVGSRGGKQDAEDIRRGNRHLFMALDIQEGKRKPAEEKARD